MIALKATVVTSASPPGSNIRARAKTVSLNVQDAMWAAAEILKARSLELVPRDTGQLADSARVVRLASDPFSVFVQYTAPYAMHVHEDLSISHPQHGAHNCGGQAKFLEQPAREMKNEMLSMVKQAVRK